MFILRFKDNIKVGLKVAFCGSGDEHAGVENTKFLSRQSSVQAALCHSFNSHGSLLLDFLALGALMPAVFIWHLLRIYEL
jgi:hypothetical protein